MHLVYYHIVTATPSPMVHLRDHFFWVVFARCNLFDILHILKSFYFNSEVQFWSQFHLLVEEIHLPHILILDQRLFRVNLLFADFITAGILALFKSIFWLVLLKFTRKSVMVRFLLAKWAFVPIKDSVGDGLIKNNGFLWLIFGKIWVDDFISHIFKNVISIDFTCDVLQDWFERSTIWLKLVVTIDLDQIALIFFNKCTCKLYLVFVHIKIHISLGDETIFLFMLTIHFFCERRILNFLSTFCPLFQQDTVLFAQKCRVKIAQIFSNYLPTIVTKNFSYRPRRI